MSSQMTQAHPGNQVRVAAAVLLAPVGGRTLEPILPPQSLSDVSIEKFVNRRPIFCVLTLKAEPDYPSGFHDRPGAAGRERGGNWG